MKRIGYARTTIIEDDLKNQLTTLQSFGCDDIFQETFDPQAEISVLDEVEKLLSAGDTLIVCKLHHLGKTTRQLTDFMKMLKEKQVDFVSISEGIDTHLPTGEAYFQLMESLSAMECALIKERTLVGLHKARENVQKSMDAPSAKSVHYIMKTKKQSNLFLINAAFRWALVISTSIYLRQMSSGCIPKNKKEVLQMGLLF